MRYSFLEGKHKSSLARENYPGAAGELVDPRISAYLHVIGSKYSLSKARLMYIYIYMEKEGQLMQHATEEHKEHIVISFRT